MDRFIYSGEVGVFPIPGDKTIQEVGTNPYDGRASDVCGDLSPYLESIYPFGHGLFFMNFSVRSETRKAGQHIGVDVVLARAINNFNVRILR
jgi:hypothetical protein